MALSKIFVIYDPTMERQPAFERGLDSARDTGAQLHLYCCANAGTGFPDETAAHAALMPQLNALAGRGAEAGHNITVELEWNEDWASQAVNAAARAGAAMIFKSSFEHSAVERELRQTSDWTLLRNAPCPVLLVKDQHDWNRRRVLAAINPASAEAAHQRLDTKIISFAQQMASNYGSDAHFVSAFSDLNRSPDPGDIASRCGTETAHVHLRKGKAANVIRDVAAELDVDLVIVGTVARDGIKGRVVGNTCERLLDQTDSDLLVLN